MYSLENVAKDILYSISLKLSYIDIFRLSLVCKRLYEEIVKSKTIKNIVHHEQ